MRPITFPWAQLRVARTYAPTQNGAKRFALRYGENLICVRHRLDANGTMRHTTVELLVESTPIVKRGPTVIALRLPNSTRETRAQLLACGAQWKSKQKYWTLPLMVAKQLGLMHYRVPTRDPPTPG
jgi:hypothetical protein